MFDPLFASQVTPLTGPFPAKHGYRIAGVNDIRAKGLSFQNRGSVTTVWGEQRPGLGALEYARLRGSLTS